jgi:hypothetical protein
MVKPVVAICFFQGETSCLKNKKVYNLIVLLGKKQTARKQPLHGTSCCLCYLWLQIKAPLATKGNTSTAEKQTGSD